MIESSLDVRYAFGVWKTEMHSDIKGEHMIVCTERVRKYQAGWHRRNEYSVLPQHRDYVGAGLFEHLSSNVASDSEARFVC